jgi:predicted transcriptional regulator
MSVDALMRLLTPQNRALLAMIAQEAPRSVSELAARSGRDQGNLSRTLDKLEQAGLLRLVADGREKRPELLRRQVHISLDLAADRADCA